ncbi:sortase [Conexibacter sp. JD483]|uniref:sortase n=1 Tax=unclassified Conexibacter TaxID=2627773 RepID=UPI00271A84A6|nr:MULTISPECIES: sortase [unclassified Conexibacter]MDO8186951.1 sortase [Conexibacter sp. CPCC 205706]MDO8200594.1 sortase [Conexibacter sp. CPCC 205762]MDR9368828.1 sortase [Conexibacter sp. JD483]
MATAAAAVAAAGCGGATQPRATIASAGATRPPATTAGAVAEPYADLVPADDVPAAMRAHAVAPGSAAARRLARRAAAYRRATEHGMPVGLIVLPRDERVVPINAGLDQATIDRQPGWYERSHLPGEGRLIYVAGHNRTHGGPFHAVASARRGDPIVVSLPYATARYTVISRRQESERSLGLLRPGRRELLRLQTSTYPPGHHRWIVDARLDALIPNG